MSRNVIVAQSGGPSPVINASLLGVVEACRAYPNAFGRIYAGFHGIEGVLCEQLLDMSVQSEKELKLLKTTPSASAAGTCRYQLSSEDTSDLQRILDVFRAHDIGYFFCIGGNDSMDTAHKIDRFAAQNGYPLIVAGIPKTIDNDLGDETFQMLDHTPGYGSCARYWALNMQNAEEENRAMHPSECVSVYQAMGRRAGFITAAARLGDPERRFPMLLFFAETGLGLEALGERVNAVLKCEKRCIVVVNEGLDIGESGARHDAFGHIEYGASGLTAMQAAVSYLNQHHLCARGQATGQIPGVMQRSCSFFLSETDVREAYEVAVSAVQTALKQGSGLMATICRAKMDAYQAVYGTVPLEVVANSERFLPKAWITPDGTDVTDDFIRYARPLIGEQPVEIPFENGLQRFARLEKRFAGQMLTPYCPANFR